MFGLNLLDKEEDWLGQEIEDTVGDHLSVDGDDVGAISNTPDDGVDGPEDEEDDSRGSVGSADILANSVSHLSGGDHEEVEDEEHCDSCTGEPSPLVLCSGDGSDETADNHKEVQHDCKEDLGGRHVGSQEKLEEQERSGDGPVDVPSVVDGSGSVGVSVAADLDLGDTDGGSHCVVGHCSSEEERGSDPVECAFADCEVTVRRWTISSLAMTGCPDRTSWETLTGLSQTPDGDDEGRNEHDKVDEPGKVGSLAAQTRMVDVRGQWDGRLCPIIVSPVPAVVLEYLYCKGFHVLHRSCASLTACWTGCDEMLELVGRQEVARDDVRRLSLKVGCDREKQSCGARHRDCDMGGYVYDNIAILRCIVLYCIVWHFKRRCRVRSICSWLYLDIGWHPVTALSCSW